MGAAAWSLGEQWGRLGGALTWAAGEERNSLDGAGIAARDRDEPVSKVEWESRTWVQHETGGGLEIIGVWEAPSAGPL